MILMGDMSDLQIFSETLKQSYTLILTCPQPGTARQHLAALHSWCN